MAHLTVGRLSPWSITLVLALPVPIFVALNLALGVVLFAGNNDTTGVGAFLRFFDLNGEQTVPAWYSTVLLALAAFATAAVAVTKHFDAAPFVRHWYALAGIFIILSMDEALAIHEQSMGPLRDLLQVGGLLYFTWVVPGILFVTIVGAIYLRFILTIPRRLARNIVIAAVIYVGGALFLEMLGGLFYELYGPGILTRLTAILEEAAEMVGIIWYIHALADHLLSPQTAHDRQPEQPQPSPPIASPAE